MNLFVDGFGYNLWASARIIDSIRALDDAKLRRPVEGIYGSVLETLRHLLQVEDGYLELLGVRPRLLPEEPGFVQCASLVAPIGQAYIDYAQSLTEAEAARKFAIPWFERSVTLADGLTQVFTHSIEHRADLASALTRLGVKTPPIDYVLFAFERDGHPVSPP